jgi:hypothetical protein
VLIVDRWETTDDPAAIPTEGLFGHSIFSINDSVTFLFLTGNEYND